MTNQNSSFPSDSDALTFKEAMNFLRVSRSTLYRLIYGQEIVPFQVGSPKPGKRLFFRLQDVLSLRNARTPATASAA